MYEFHDWELAIVLHSGSSMKVSAIQFHEQDIQSVMRIVKKAKVTETKTTRSIRANSCCVTESAWNGPVGCIHYFPHVVNRSSSSSLPPPFFINKKIIKAILAKTHIRLKFGSKPNILINKTLRVWDSLWNPCVLQPTNAGFSRLPFKSAEIYGVFEKCRSFYIKKKK